MFQRLKDIVYFGFILFKTLITEGNKLYINQKDFSLFKKEEMDDLTIIIPLFYDSEDRLINLERCLNHIKEYFDVKIIVLEAGEIPRFKEVCKGIEYHFVKDDNKMFYRTKYLNILTKMTNTKFVLNLDVDVLINPYGIQEGIDLLRKDKIDIVYPYNGVFIDGEYSHIKEKISKKKLNIFDYINTKLRLYEHQSVGALFLFNKEKYQSVGAENENFKSWGSEDSERFLRMKKVGLRVYRTNNVIFHQRHRRGDNSGVNIFSEENEKEFEKIEKMSKKELLEYIKTW